MISNECKELIKGIRNDEILAAITEEAQEAIRDTKDIFKRAEKREYELRKELESNIKDGYKAPATTDIDAIEKDIESRESEAHIVRKIFALANLKLRPNITFSEYREALCKYFMYCTPIFADLDAAKESTLKKIGAINKEYAAKIASLKSDLAAYEAEIERLFYKADHRAEYLSDKDYNALFGRKSSSSEVSDAYAKSYENYKG